METDETSGKVDLKEQKKYEPILIDSSDEENGVDRKRHSPQSDDAVVPKKCSKTENSVKNLEAVLETYAESSHRHFGRNELQNFSRKSTFECILPRTRLVSNYNVVHYKEKQSVTDPCRETAIPTQSLLLRWQSELEKGRIAAEYFYIEFSHGVAKRYDLQYNSSA
ncbi:uncharacterized protein LOC130621809 [Hydractinia symbiolongicarpus]|uniref:uncharacterized protein LOC130621809 n=1 Tax=Hydractinia symbiolongicarpus TaxID=13093 RepID=UPI002550C174|nr:uncharacterized protein LOC130621809 [Hydractinia symbiolongicarpus]